MAKNTLLALSLLVALAVLPGMMHAAQPACPTTSIQSASVTISNPQIQPGAYDQVSMNVQLARPNNPSGNFCASAWQICGTGSGNPLENGAPACTIDLKDSSGATLATGTCSSSSTCTVLGCSSISCSINGYTTGSEVSSISPYSITTAVVYYRPWCATTVGIPPSNFCAGPIGPEVASASVNPPANYYVFNAFPDSPVGTTGAPLQISASWVSGGANKAEYIQGQTPLWTQASRPTGSPPYVVSLELSSLGGSCTYGGMPHDLIGSYLPPGVSDIPACGQAPNGNQNCWLSYTGMPNLPPTSGISTNWVDTATTNLPPGYYWLCAYAGYVPNTNQQDPWPVYFADQQILVTCPGAGVNGQSNGQCNTGSSLGGGPPATLNAITDEACSLYSQVNTLLFLLALTIMILGAALYAGSSVLPGQSKGTIRGYAFGLFFAGLIGVIIALVATYVLTVAANQPVANILNICP